MKLYATVTSERATKGQGGNKDIKITLQIGSTKENKHIATILLNALPAEASRDNIPVVVMQVWDIDRGELCERQIYSLQGENITKGEKQKGKNDDDKCKKCGSYNKDSYESLC